MTKAPQPGKVKTRLTPPLTPQESAQLNGCFLKDISISISQACAESPARGVAVYTPLGMESVYNEILPKDFMLLPQREGSFGERLIFAAGDLFAVGFRSVCLINSDSPTVPASCFAEAANELAKPGDRVVLGPSDDGGYYLIGLKKLHRPMFEQIDWSTERVFEQSRQRAQEIRVALHELAVGSDVDDASALGRLCGQLFGSKLNDEVAPNTRRFLKTIVDREGRERLWPH